MIIWAGLAVAGIGSAVGVSLKRRDHRQAPLLAAATAAGALITLTAIDALLS
jgi:uncharacterized lipoprotein YajG